MTHRGRKRLAHRANERAGDEAARPPRRFRMGGRRAGDGEASRTGREMERTRLAGRFGRDTGAA